MDKEPMSVDDLVQLMRLASVSRMRTQLERLRTESPDLYRQFIYVYTKAKRPDVTT